MNLKEHYRMHFIDSDTEDDKIIYKRTAFQVPRVGDELRFDVDVYYKVTMVVWVYDEPDTPYSRVNIGVSQEGF